MKNNIQKNKKTTQNVIGTFCRLSDGLEDSGTTFIGHYGDGFKIKRKSDRDRTYTDEECEEIRKDIAELSKYLKTNELQTLVFVAVYSEQLSGDRCVGVDDVSRFYNLSAINFLPLRGCFDELVEKGILVTFRRHGNLFYRVMPELEKAMQGNVPYTFSRVELDRYQFCQRVSDYIEDRSNNEISTSELFCDVENLEKENASIQMVEDLLTLQIGLEERTLFYEVCDDFVRSRGGNTSVSITLRDIYRSRQDGLAVGKQIMDGEHPLQIEDLIKLESANFFTESEIVLTDKGKKFFLNEDLELFAKKKSSEILISPEKIKEKKLFFDAKTTATLGRLRDCMRDEQLAQFQKQLEKNALPQGITVLFYGAAGTGKTESVLQLAKETGRSVFHVDISACKSKWFGDSEKIMKNLFDTYREICKTEPLKPILLFNEADALFCKRKDSDASNLAQTENAIQNILLEEVERLDGILIATTNLEKNFDSAFARRFLFKVPFNQPTVEAKKSIWLSKLNWLSEEDADVLARDHDLSGGEIDNVVRKALMEEVMNGSRPDRKTLSEWCKEERMCDGKSGKIGFAV